MEQIQEYKRYWTKKKLKEQNSLTEKKQKMIEMAQKTALLLAQKYHIKKVYLIGSLVGSSTFDENSDIDLVVQGLPDENYFRALGDLYKILTPDLKDVQIDLIPYEDAEGSLIHHTIQNGEILFERK